MWAVDSTKSPSGQVTTDAPSPSLMREDLSQLIYHDKIFQRITLSTGGLGPVVLSLDTSPYCGWEETGLGRGQRFSTSLLLNRKLSPIPDRVTALRPWPEVIWSPHKETLYSLSPPWPWSNHPKVDPQLQQRKLFLAPFVSFGKHNSLWLLYYKSEDSGENVSSMGLTGLECLHRGLLILSHPSVHPDVLLCFHGSCH